MSTLLLVEQRMAVPTPRDIAAYLLSGGWTHVSQDDRWAIYECKLEDERVTIEVPLRLQASDYPRAVRVLVEDLARLTGEHPVHVLQAMHQSTMDVVRLGLRGAYTEGGHVPVEAGARAYQAARDLLLAAACAAREPRAAYPRRKPTEAMEHLRKARFGLAEVGSYVLTIETPVPPQLKRQTLPAEGVGRAFEEEPFERKVGLTLALSLTEALSAAQETQTSQELAPFTNRISRGVSANLCEALAALMDAAESDALAVDFSFASCRPIGGEKLRIRPLRFSSDLKLILQEAAADLREEAPLGEIEIEGPIRKLERANPDPAQDGEITVYAEVEGKMRSVAIRLDGNKYQQAVQAHRDGLLIRCRGTLEKLGTKVILQDPHAWGVVVEEEPTLVTDTDT